jgi:hypothetical protein
MTLGAIPSLGAVISLSRGVGLTPVDTPMQGLFARPVGNHPGSYPFVLYMTYESREFRQWEDRFGMGWMCNGLLYGVCRIRIEY